MERERDQGGMAAQAFRYLIRECFETQEGTAVYASLVGGHGGEMLSKAFRYASGSAEIILLAVPVSL